MNKLPEDPIKYLRLADFSGGRNTTITPALLNANESPTAKRMSFDQKGTIRPGWGRVSRYDEPFSDQPVSGLGEYRKNDGRTWLMIGAGDKIYYDRPSMTWKWEGDALPDDMLQPPDDPTFTRSSVAYKQDGTQVAANVPRFEDGQYGKAVMVEEGTTNLVQNGSCENGTTNFKAINNATISADNSTSWQGTSSIKVVCPGIDIPEGAMTTATATSCSPNTVYTGSLYIKGTGNVQILLCVLPGGIILASQNISLNSNWQRVALTGTTKSDSASIYMIVWTKTVQAITFWIDGVQIEQKPYATSFIDGTRSTESLTIPTDGVLDPQEGTVELTVIPQNSYTGTAQIHFEANAGTTNKNQIFLFNEAGYWKMGLVDKNGVWRRVDWAYDGQRGAPTRLAVTWKNCNSGEANAAVKVYQDGAPKGTIANVKIDMDPFTICAIGRRATSLGLIGNALYDDLRISSIARSDEEIAEAYASGEPLEIDHHTTYSMKFDGDLSHREAYGWNSPVVNVGTAKDKASGYASVEIESGSVSVFSRSAPADNGPWTSWVPAASDGKLLHEADNFVQLRLATFATGVVVKSITVIFDASPNATLLKDELTPNSIYCFKTFRNTLLIANGNDPLQKWDGEAETTSDVEGEPPAFALIEVHQNRLWGIKDKVFPSRLRFTDLLNYESWPALNFIDVSPDDGDVPTALRSNGTYLMIHKSKRTAVLVGDQTENYNITWLEAESGAQGQWAVAQTDRYLSYVAQDGIRFSDLTTSVNAIERLLPDWENINRRLLYKSAQAYWGHLLLTSLPGTGAVTGNTETWVYDAMRNAWTLRDDWAFSCFTKFNEYGSDVLLAGDATTGQVYKITPEPLHDGVPVEYEWKSKELNFNEPERYKVWSTVYILVEGEKRQRTLQVRFYVDGDLKGGPDLVIPAGEGVVHTVRLFPSQYNAIFGQRLAISLKGSNGVHLITIGYTLRTFALGVL